MRREALEKKLQEEEERKAGETNCEEKEKTQNLNDLIQRKTSSLWPFGAHEFC